MDSSISTRISITRYLMVIGIIVLHVPPYQPLDALDGSAFEYLKAFFSHGVFRATVPVLTAISGYLVFATGLHKKPMELFNKKTLSIFVPLVIWNLPIAIAVYVAQAQGLLSYDFRVSLYPFDAQQWADAIVGLAGTPVNYPLNFLRDLFVVSLMTPLFWLLLKRIPYLGILILFAVYWFNLDGPIVIRNTMILSFYTGALAATQNWNMKALDGYALHTLFAFLAICVAVVAFTIMNREFLRLLSPFLLWPGISLLVGTRAGDWLAKNSRHSFFTFLAHGPILLVAWIVYQALPVKPPYALFWFGIPVIIVFACIVLNTLFRRYFPGVAKVVLGGR